MAGSPPASTAGRCNPQAASDPFALGFAHLGNCVHEHHVTGDWDAALHHAREGMAAFAAVDASHEWGSIAYLEPGSLPAVAASPTPSPSAPRC